MWQTNIMASVTIFLALRANGFTGKESYKEINQFLVDGYGQTDSSIANSTWFEDQEDFEEFFELASKAYPQE